MSLGGGTRCCSARVLPVLCARDSTRNQRVRRRLSTSLTPASWDGEAKDDGLSCLRSPDTNYSIISYSTNRLTGIDGRLIIHKKTSVTGRHNLPLFLFHLPLSSFYSLRIQERIFQVASTRMCYADRYESLFVEHVHQESSANVDFRYACRDKTRRNKHQTRT
jgi:hypothetical protein